MATKSTTSFTIRRQPFQGPLARQLVAEMVQELIDIYGEPKSDTFARTPLEVPVNDAATDDVAFFVAVASTPINGASTTGGEEAMGCVAVKLSPPSVAAEFGNKVTAELKRMYVRAGYQRMGVGQALLSAAEEEAKERMGVELLLLETGVRQGPSIRLYERNGWKETALFGPYTESGVKDGGFSLCYEKMLV